jgi:hypothetical protein
MVAPCRRVARELLEYLQGLSSEWTDIHPGHRSYRPDSCDRRIAAAIRALDPEQQGVYCVDPKESAGGQAEITETNAGRFLRRRILPLPG